MKVFARDEFSANRRRVLDDAEARLHPTVERALESYGERGWFDPIIEAAIAVFEQTFYEESGEHTAPGLKAAEDHYATVLTETLGKTGEPREDTAEIIERFIATGAVNAGTLFAAEQDTETMVYEWVTMHDSHVRAQHKVADGQVRRHGEPFHIGESELMYPGDPSGHIEDWINCRCVLRPDLASAHSLTAAGDPKPAVIVALPHAGDAVHDMGDEPKHLTLLYLGDDVQDPQAIKDAVGRVAADGEPYSDKVSGSAKLGKDGANVLLLDGANAVAAREALLREPVIEKQVASAQQFPTFIPHVTLNYGEDAPAGIDQPAEITFDRLAVWHGDDQTEFELGEQMPTEDQDQEAAAVPIPWHGVLAPEGVPSGDKRKFALGSLSNRPLPLPLTWQKMSADGHDGSVVVARIDGLDIVDGQARAYGVFLTSPEADEVVGQLAEFGRFGVSVDIDDAEFELDEDAGETVFTSARICSASIVPIPAFAEAYVSLGEAPWLAEEPTDMVAALAFAISEKPWNGSQSRFTPEEWRRSCVLHWNNSLNKSDHAFPIREPDGALSRAAVHNAAARINQAKGWPPSAVAAAKGALRRAYGQLNEDVPDSLTASGEEELAAFTPYKRGTKVSWHYRSAIGHGTIESVAKLGTSNARTLYNIREHDHHPGEPDIVQHYGSALTVEQSAAGEVEVSASAETEEFRRGAGWVTHPRATRRIHSYWTTPGQPGYAKIAWGAPGDFNRCRVEVGKYLVESGETRFINQTCAQWHHDALGYWPATHAKMEGKRAHALELVAAAGVRPPAAWFRDPGLDGPTPLHIVPDEATGLRRVYGHLATWGTCHIGFPNACVTAPSSATDYAYFKTGAVLTDEGEMAVGNITMGGGHAKPGLGMREALAHYDATSTVISDVAVGEDEFGIWTAGWMRPNATEDDEIALRAAALSGDWRRANGNLELIAALAVNVPGFPIPRAQAGVQDGVQIALVAAGVLQTEQSAPVAPVEALAEQIAEAMEQRAARRVVAGELSSRFTSEQVRDLQAVFGE
jgi:2'-5' RNA ligase